MTVFDILGTKGVWKSNPFKFISDVTFLFTEYKKSIESLRSSLIESLKIVNKDIEIIMDFKTFSDTVFIIFGINSKSIEEYKTNLEEKTISDGCSIIFLCIGILLIGFLNASFHSKIYFRGSIGLGTIYKEEDIIIGPAIDEAAEDHQQSNWIGISLTPSASIMLNSLISKNNTFSKVLGDLYTKHDLPKKKGIEKDCFVVNWSKFFVKGITPDSVDIIKNNLKFESDQYMNYDIYMKYKNTLDYCKMIKKEEKYDIESYFNDNLIQKLLKELV